MIILYKKLKKQIKEKARLLKRVVKDKSKKISVLKYESLVSEKKFQGKTIRVWSNAIQKAIDENEVIFIPKGRDYYVDTSLILPSNRTIIADKKAKIILIEEFKSLLLRNKDVIDGSDYSIKSDNITENICIMGGIWSTTATKRAKYGDTCCFDENDSMHGVYTSMLFSNVKNLVLKDLVFEKTSAFAIQIGKTENFYIENISFINCFADGVHLNGSVKQGHIKNIRGECEDDLVALNAYDWDNSTINLGCIENVLIENIKSSEGRMGYKCIRLQPGIYPYQDGTKEDCYLKNIIIKDVNNLGVFKMYLQTPEYKYLDKPEKDVGVGQMENIFFKNIDVVATSPMDKQPNYLESKEIVGYFGAFEMGSDIDGVYFDSVKVKLDRKKYPLSQMIMIGPKSQYLPEYNVELFDPYVCCQVKNLVFKKVKINGKKLDCYDDYIKEICFDKIYEGDLSSGKGILLDKINVKR